MKNQRKRSKNARGLVEKDGGARLLFVWLVWLPALPPSPLLGRARPTGAGLSLTSGPSRAARHHESRSRSRNRRVQDTLHIHARDDTQTPSFQRDLVSIGQAADADTLLGGFLPASIIVKQDLLAGMTFQQAPRMLRPRPGSRNFFQRCNDDGIRALACRRPPIVRD